MASILSGSTLMCPDEAMKRDLFMQVWRWGFKVTKQYFLIESRFIFKWTPIKVSRHAPRWTVYSITRYAMKFCFKFGKIASETHKIIKSAYGDDVISRSNVFESHKLFWEGREQVENDHHSGCPSTTKIYENLVIMKNLLNSVRRLNMWITSEHFNLPTNIVHEMVTENLGMRKVWAKLDR